MSKRKGRTNVKLEKLNGINQIDRRMKKIKGNEEEIEKLLGKRNQLRQQLKTTR